MLSSGSSTSCSGVMVRESHHFRAQVQLAENTRAILHLYLGLLWICVCICCELCLYRLLLVDLCPLFCEFVTRFVVDT